MTSEDLTVNISIKFDPLIILDDTPLIFAAKQQSCNAINNLIIAGANKSAVNSAGNNYLNYKTGCPNIVQRSIIFSTAPVTSTKAVTFYNTVNVFSTLPPGHVTVII